MDHRRDLFHRCPDHVSSLAGTHGTHWEDQDRLGRTVGPYGHFATYYERGKDKLTDTLREMIEEGRKTLAVDYNRAVDWREVLNAGLDQVFERYDAIITPAAAGSFCT